MADGDDCHDALPVVDPVEDPIRPSATGPEAFEFEAERLSEPAPVRRDRLKRFDNRSRRLLRQLAELTCRRRGDD
jgi:hypothetical protein